MTCLSENDTVKKQTMRNSTKDEFCKNIYEQMRIPLKFHTNGKNLHTFSASVSCTLRTIARRRLRKDES